MLLLFPANADADHHRSSHSPLVTVPVKHRTLRPGCNAPQPCSTVGTDPAHAVSMPTTVSGDSRRSNLAARMQVAPGPPLGSLCHLSHTCTPSAPGVETALHDASSRSLRTLQLPLLHISAADRRYVRRVADDAHNTMDGTPHRCACARSGWRRLDGWMHADHSQSRSSGSHSCLTWSARRCRCSAHRQIGSCAPGSGPEQYGDPFDA
jgi:hypothetical protein